MKTNEVYGKLREAKAGIERALYQHNGFRKEILNFDEIEMEDTTDPDEIGRRNALWWLLDALGDVVDTLDYYDRPVTVEGVLERNNYGRYELDGYELTTGATLEFLMVPEDEDEPASWVKTIVLHDTDYYLKAGHRRLDGVRARLRRDTYTHEEARDLLDMD